MGFNVWKMVDSILMTGLELTDTLFESLIENHSKRLLNRAFYLVSNKEDAEDIVQEVFLVAYHKKESLRDVQSAEAWLLGILHHKVSDMYKERYRKPIRNIHFEQDFDEYGEWKRTDVANDWAESPDSLEALLDNTDFRKSFYGCLDKLPPRWKIAVKLYYLRSKKAVEICQELNMTTTAYWKLLQRSRLQLRECIEISWFSK